MIRTRAYTTALTLVAFSVGGVRAQAQATQAQTTPAQTTPAQTTPAQTTPAQATPAQATPAQAPATRAPVAQAADLQALAEAYRDSADAPALGLMVVQPGSAPRIAVTGVRCAGSAGEVAAGDLWHWGSVTKSMTATLVARLVEKGVVRWDETIGELLGDSVPDMRDEYRDATFLHLLSHRAGLPSNIPIYRFREFGQHPDHPMAERLRWVRIALSQEPVGPKGETFSYANNGYIVAGAMLEAATGTPWEELIRREVFEPLGMTRAGFGAPVDREPGEQPCGHVPGSGGDQPVRINADNPAALGPAGRVSMPLSDMARYLEAHATRPEGFLSAASWDRLHTPPFGGNYALGWVATAPRQWWHNGSNTMWYAEVAFEAYGRAAAVVVNDGNLQTVQPAVRALLAKLMRDDG